ncbi:M18 family aminopeptidase [Corynebacterium sp. ES2775-CONJ]|uniref:M18 family aminopeptidase n=1 Tax=Corynebacterium sp. ES2775-CONJ TaxID=2974029 RepID=UPI00216A26FB|nr:M18 family aminopeptidase [Corynebacterium sp. ES2775-CONJ]MCS4489338.1 M18 family aminopeptidase [Corynebacterium sp. ES2775-CONJ]
MDDIKDFIHAAPSSFHAAHLGAQLLAAAGFVRQEETEQWNSTPGGHYLIRGGALVAWFIPEGASDHSGFRIIGAHTDSPGFKLKFHGDLHRHGFNQAAVEVYGGPIIPSWFDRELRLAGSLGLKNGSTVLVDTPALFRIPLLAIHLDRTSNEALKIDRQQHTQPIYAVGYEDTSITDILAQSAGVAADDIISHDLITCDAQRGEYFGLNEEFLAAGRLDNLSSVFPGIKALIEAVSAGGASNKSDVLVLACFDHEEVGSQSITGAAGPLLGDVLERTAVSLGANYDAIKRIYARSHCVSADAAHSLHPNYADKHDTTNFPILGSGPVLKVNANQRYASTTETSAMWITACERAGVNSQVFVGHNAVPCGSTIGPVSATRLGIPTVDVGIPLLSMHSARELCHREDLAGLQRALHSYLVA